MSQITISKKCELSMMPKIEEVEKDRRQRLLHSYVKRAINICISKN